MGYPPHAQPGGSAQPGGGVQPGLVLPGLTPQGVHQSPGQPAGAQASQQPIPGPGKPLEKISRTSIAIIITKLSPQRLLPNLQM